MNVSTKTVPVTKVVPCSRVIVELTEDEAKLLKRISTRCITVPEALAKVGDSSAGVEDFLFRLDEALEAARVRV